MTNTTLHLYQAFSKEPGSAPFVSELFICAVVWNETPGIGSTIYTNHPSCINSSHGTRTYYEVVRTKPANTLGDVIKVAVKKLREESY